MRIKRQYEIRSFGVKKSFVGLADSFYRQATYEGLASITQEQFYFVYAALQSYIKIRFPAQERLPWEKELPVYSSENVQNLSYALRMWGLRDPNYVDPWYKPAERKVQYVQRRKPELRLKPLRGDPQDLDE